LIEILSRYGESSSFEQTYIAEQQPEKVVEEWIVAWLTKQLATAARDLQLT